MAGIIPLGLEISMEIPEVGHTTFKHGWLYIHGNDEIDLWIFDETLGWLYTGKNLFPKLYRNSTQSWIFDQSDVNNRKFWDYKNSVSLQPPKN